MSEPRSRGSLAGSTALHLILMLVLGLLAYSNTLDVPFQFDDHLVITDSPTIKDISNLPAILTGRKGTFASRAVMRATLALNYHMGGLDTRGYHAVNLALHLANGILLYLLMVMTWTRTGREGRDIRPAAAFSALLFVLHPAQTEAVTNVVNRSALMATTFSLLGTVLFLKAATAEKRRGLYVAALFLVSLLGMGSRENFAVFPVMLFVYDLFFVSRFRPKEISRHWPAYLAVVASAGYLAFLVINNTYDKGVEYLGPGIPRAGFLATQFKVHWTYLRLFALPVNQSLDYGYPIARGLFELPVLAAFAGYLGLWAGGIGLARRRPVAAFAALWFLVFLLPISFGVALMKLRLDDVIFEHRFYLPAVGLFALSGVAASSLYERVKAPGARRIALALLLLLPLVLGLAAHQRNKVWRTELALWSDAVAKAPGSDRARFNLGVAFDRLGRTEEAFGQYEEALAIKPEAPKPHVGLGVIYARKGMLDEAILHYQKAIDVWPEFSKARYNMGNAYFRKGLMDDAIEQYLVAIKWKPYDSDARFNLATAYMEKGVPALAIEQYVAAIKLRPDYLKAHQALAVAYQSVGMPEKAAEHARIAGELQRSGR